jgi:hypothetical protein
LAKKHHNKPNHQVMGEAVLRFREASRDPASSVSHRFETTAKWARIADEENDSSALEAYSMAIELLPQLAMLGLDLQSRHRALKLKSNIGLASDAAAHAHRLNIMGKAVEFLETGRSVFWSQALQLHTSLDALKPNHPQLEKRVEYILKELGKASHRDVAHIRTLPPPHREHNAVDIEDRHYRTLNAEWLGLIQTIRNLKGFEEFLRIKKLDGLRKAATNGPVIILNASKSCCTAFVVRPSQEVQGVNMEQMSLALAQFHVDFLRELRKGSGDLLLGFLTSLKQTPPETPSQIAVNLMKFSAYSWRHFGSA